MLLKEVKKSVGKTPVDTDEEYGIDAGRYLGVHFTPETKKMLKDIVHSNGIPNPVPEDKLHTTVAYSKDNTFDDYKVRGKLEEPIEAEIDEFTTLGDENALVAKLKAPSLEDIHNTTRELGASYDYDSYIPHVTLSYEPGDVTPELLDKLNKKYKGYKLYADEEYDSPIEKDWSKNFDDMK